MVGIVVSATCGDGVDHHGQTVQRTQGAPDGTLTQFALRVVSELRCGTAAEAGSPQNDVLDLLLSHATSGSVAPLSDLFKRLKRSGITAEQIIDTYFPAAITRIGTEWHDADLDILQATLRMSRLQTLLRELGRAWISDSVGTPMGPRVLLALPGGEQHTLGAMIAANQMRRIGVSVRVCLVPTPQLLKEQLKNHRFDAVFVSVSNRSCLASGADLVNTIRSAPHGDLPVVLGGGILRERDESDMSALARRVGADLATLDVSAALAICGFNTNAQAAE